MSERESELESIIRSLQADLTREREALAALAAERDALVRLLIVDGHREDCCDAVNDWCDNWLANNPEPEPAGVES